MVDKVIHNNRGYDLKFTGELIGSDVSESHNIAVNVYKTSKGNYVVEHSGTGMVYDTHEDLVELALNTSCIMTRNAIRNAGFDLSREV
jgi:hypothetical protein